MKIITVFGINLLVCASLHAQDNRIKSQIIAPEETTPEQLEKPEAPKPQQSPEASTYQKVYYGPDKLPEFPGGATALTAYIKSEIRYPAFAMEKNIQGKVAVKFTIDKEGKITDAKIVKGIGGGCDREAMRIVNSMPLWKPAELGGMPIRWAYTVFVDFKLPHE